MTQRNLPSGAAGLAAPAEIADTRSEPDRLASPPMIDVALSRSPRETPPSRLDPAERVLERLVTDPGSLPNFAIPALPQPGAAPLAAMACPDLFLFGLPYGAARHDVAAQLVFAAVAARARIVLLAPNTSAVDVLIESLAARGVAAIGRALAPGEHPTLLPPASRQRTTTALAERERRDLAIQWQRQITTLQEREQTLREIEQLAAQRAALAIERQELPTALPAHEHMVHARSEIEARFRSHLSQVEAEERDSLQAREHLRRELEDLKKQTAPPSGFFKRLFAGSSTNQAVQLRIAQAEEQLRRIEMDGERFARTRAATEAEYRSGCERLLAEELARRQAQIDAQIEALASQEAGLRQSSGLGHHECAASVGAELDQIRTALAELPNRPLIPSRATLHATPVVIGTLEAVQHDPYLMNGHPESDPPFDKLILLEGEHLSEAEFLSAARLARTWVVFGSPCTTTRKPYRNGKPLPRGGFFEWAWSCLDRRPFRREAGRLVAELMPVPSESRASLHCEPLADDRAIELRFGEAPDGTPTLAEVAFPASTTLRQAKKFLAEQLCEIRLTALGLPEWQEDPENFVCRFPSVQAWPVLDRLKLENGVTEVLVGTASDLRTSAVCFARASGWSRDEAEAWLQARVTNASRVLEVR